MNIYNVIVDGVKIGIANSKVAAYWYVRQWILMGHNAHYELGGRDVI